MSLPSTSPCIPTGQAINYLGIQLYDEGVQEHWDRWGRNTAIRTVLCGWEDRTVLIEAAMGLSTVNSAGQSQANAAIPYPDAPQFLFVDKVDVVGVPGEGGLKVGVNSMVGYKYARCELHYSTLPYDQGDYNVTSLDYAVEEVSVPDGGFIWADDSTPVPAGSFPSLRVVTVTISIEQFNQVQIPSAVVMSLGGKVNSGVFFGQAAETIIFLGARSQRRMALNGLPNQDMTYTFQFNPNTWNKKLKKQSGGSLAWVKITGPSGNPPFLLGDFTPLGVLSPFGLLGNP